MKPGWTSSARPLLAACLSSVAYDSTDTVHGVASPQGCARTVAYTGAGTQVTDPISVHRQRVNTKAEAAASGQMAEN